MATLTVTDELLTAALAGYRAELEQIEIKMGEIRRMLGDRPNDGAAPSDGGRPRHRFSKKASAKMAASQRLRWKKIKHAAATPKAESGTPKKRRKMSAAGKAAIVAAVKKRWAAVRAAKKAQKSAVAKKVGRKKTVPKKSVRAKRTATAPEQSTAVAASQ